MHSHWLHKIGLGGERLGLVSVRPSHNLSSSFVVADDYSLGFGYAGLSYLIDPVTGIAIVVGSQIIPTMDAGAVTLFNKVEDIVYANLA